MKRILVYLSALLMIFHFDVNAQQLDSDCYRKGVSLELAQFRKANYRDVRYTLFFNLPMQRQQKVTGKVLISFSTTQSVPVIIDFRADAAQVTSVKFNGKPARYELKDEHILLSPESTANNQVEISFIAADQSLNRRDAFMYTLLVPDRARTLFPCFDQPNLKAHYSLSLELPQEWAAVSNGKVLSEKTMSDHRKQISFYETEPLSTYLFSFVAGQFQKETFNRGERAVSIYYRETDPKKIAQTKDIAALVFDALEWQESYTAIPYPFAKYDVIILPGFQYGGMEHTGATLYADSRMFLNENPTLDEQLGRATLIAHETSHQWFGDYVTMDWFNDVWTKEVFANYFASKIIEPQFPQVNHRLHFISDYIPVAYAEDRTAGSNPIQQPLDNLQNAGLVYGNIIYDKAPVVLEMLAQQMHADAFRNGLREYLKRYGYGNATWNDLIAILDRYSKEDLKAWSRVWCEEKGMPEITTSLSDDSLIVTQRDPLNRGLLWPQELRYLVKSKEGADTVSVSLKTNVSQTAVKLPNDVGRDALIVPNIDGRGYGFFRIDPDRFDALFAELSLSKDDVLKGSLLMTLYENMMNGVVTPDRLSHALLPYLQKESDPLLFSLALSYLSGTLQLMPDMPDEVEEILQSIIANNPSSSFRLQAFRLLRSVERSDKITAWLYDIWKNQKAPENCSLSENDYVALSYQLAVRLPEKADAITAEQYGRLTNPDKRTQYHFVAPSVSPSKAVRDSVFYSLMKAENRRVEPWASAALSNLNHPLRQKESVQYIRPALEILQEVQQTGDIFFPSSWLRALLAGHHSQAAAAEVDAFLAAHPDYPDKLALKIKQRADHLYR